MMRSWSFVSRLRGVVVLLVIGLAVFPFPARANDWYLTAPSNCSGTEPVMAAFVALLPSSVAIHAGTSSSVYADVPTRFVNDLFSSGNEKVIDSLVLSKAKAQDYKKAMEFVGSTYEIPYIVDVGATLYTGFALTPGLGTAAGLVFSYLLDQLKQPAAIMKGFTLFIVEGGELGRRWKVLTDGTNGIYLVSSMEYAVSIGAERRRFVTAGCAYPVKVVVGEFRTNEATGNKIVKPHGSAWGVFDIEDNKWDSTKLSLTGQDQEYYYFTEDAMENDQVVGQNVHRLSFRGGRWQYKSYSDSASAKFKNLSGTLTAQ
jgi:hypothetical protein